MAASNRCTAERSGDMGKHLSRLHRCPLAEHADNLLISDARHNLGFGTRGLDNGDVGLQIAAECTDAPA